ncbi:methyltransferase domain-containing protein [Hymenobacter sp. GOD-10R]|uniref:methyltransferase domain-containing protein n=1 Tax=Hymenobacter sp. GOD-10R TaxID=3093922 RepID=UPI002D769D7F|nr:methyltransferase domain-containing protein [Hymenobacter sp. GOD-10R]WRQ29049.1 methyltransferase domain-containing protein [Hymenobacter sp. GOD-10R]
MDLRQRATEEELMDNLTLASDDLRQNLDELETINTWLGGYEPILQAFSSLEKSFPEAPALQVADLGSGGGDTLRRIAKWGRRRGVKLALVGVDANSFMLDYAAARSQSYPEIRYEQADVFSSKFQAQQYDIITASLFCHHFPDAQLVTLLRAWQQQARRCVIINDLHRHWLAYYSIKWLTRLFRGSYLVRNDAPLSVARAFTRHDWQRLLQQAGIKKYRLRWRWAFRWQVILWSD